MAFHYFAVYNLKEIFSDLTKIKIPREVTDPCGILLTEAVGSK